MPVRSRPAAEGGLSYLVCASTPVATLDEQPGRFPLWHIKAGRETITEVGNGIVDFKADFATAKTAGLKYFFEEQDMAPDPVANSTTSYTNLKKI